ncbi:peroxiredoxin family protein [Chitinolyticbacter meiyuanensis]|uniref:peroxiredoxin family protein n=1 Tax=Chitinolyticbacter meiyuanensis TaxID=682798 RepID=UPI0011E5B0BE
MNLPLNHYVRLPEWQVSTWVNTPRSITLESLRGKVVLLHTFQMLCPGCVMHALPQAERVHQTFSDQDVAVVGLHTVFEHHSAMNVDALHAFIREFRWSFPIGVDQASPDGDVPRTMTAYGLRGTPSHIVLDQHGFVRMHQFGRVDDLNLGGLIGQLLAEADHDNSNLRMNGQVMPDIVVGNCTQEGCSR